MTGSDPSQGEIFVMYSAPISVGVERFALPKTGGPANLVSVNGDSVSVVDANGDSFTFDLRSKSWTG